MPNSILWDKYSVQHVQDIIANNPGARLNWTKKQHLVQKQLQALK